VPLQSGAELHSRENTCFSKAARGTAAIQVQLPREPAALVDRSGARARPHGAAMAPGSPARVATNGGVRGRRGGGGGRGRTVPIGSSRFRREEQRAEAIAHSRLGFALAVAAARRSARAAGGAGRTCLPRRSRKRPSDVTFRTGLPSCRWAARPTKKGNGVPYVVGPDEPWSGALTAGQSSRVGSVSPV
jgi:hypothetical protein